MRKIILALLLLATISLSAQVGNDYKNPIGTVAKMTAIPSLPDGTMVETGGFNATGDGGSAKYKYSLFSAATADGISIIAPSSGIGRFLLQVIGGNVTLKQLGVFPGNTNAQFNAAIVYTAANNYTLIGPANSTYQGDPTGGTAFTLVNNFHLKGEDKTFVVQAKSYSAQDKILFGYYSTTTRLKKVILETLTLDGQESFNGTGLFAGGSTNTDSLQKLVYANLSDSLIVRDCDLKNSIIGVKLTGSAFFHIDGNFGKYLGQHLVDMTYDSTDHDWTINNNTIRYYGMLDHYDPVFTGLKRNGETWATIGGYNGEMKGNRAFNDAGTRWYQVEGRFTKNMDIHDNYGNGYGREWGGWSVGGYPGVKGDNLQFYRNDIDSVFSAPPIARDTFSGVEKYYVTALNELGTVKNSHIYNCKTRNVAYAFDLTSNTEVSGLTLINDLLKDPKSGFKIAMTFSGYGGTTDTSNNINVHDISMKLGDVYPFSINAGEPIITGVFRNIDIQLIPSTAPAGRFLGIINKPNAGREHKGLLFDNIKVWGDNNFFKGIDYYSNANGPAMPNITFNNCGFELTNLTKSNFWFNEDSHTISAALFSNRYSDGTTDIIPIPQLATGTPSGTKFIRDDGTLAVPAGGGGITIAQADSVARKRMQDSLYTNQSARISIGLEIGDTSKTQSVDTLIVFGDSYGVAGIYPNKIARIRKSFLQNKASSGTNINYIISNWNLIPNYGTGNKTILIEYGVNVGSYTLTTFQTDYQKVLDTLTARGYPDAKIYLMSTPLTGAAYDASAYDAVINGLVTSNLLGGYIDIRTYLKNHGGLSNVKNDSLHQWLRGYEYIADAAIIKIGIKGNGQLVNHGDLISNGKTYLGTDDSTLYNITDPADAVAGDVILNQNTDNGLIKRLGGFSSNYQAGYRPFRSNESLFYNSVSGIRFKTAGGLGFSNLTDALYLSYTGDVTWWGDNKLMAFPQNMSMIVSNFSDMTINNASYKYMFRNTVNGYMFQTRFNDGAFGAVTTAHNAFEIEAIGNAHFYRSILVDSTPLGNSTDSLVVKHGDTLKVIPQSYSASQVTGILPVANGGTGSATPALVQGTNITITGTWPNQTINSSGGGDVYLANNNVFTNTGNRFNSGLFFGSAGNSAITGSSGILNFNAAGSGATALTLDGNKPLLYYASHPTGYTNQSIYDKQSIDSISAINSSGRYTPTVTNGTNVASNSGADAYYHKIGNVVMVEGIVVLTPTAGSTSTNIKISLPVALVGATAGTLALWGNATSTGNISGIISTDLSTADAKITFTSTSTSGITVYYHFSYSIN